jgi:hypothetical protein
MISTLLSTTADSSRVPTTSNSEAMLVAHGDGSGGVSNVMAR